MKLNQDRKLINMRRFKFLVYITSIALCLHCAARAFATDPLSLQQMSHINAQRQNVRQRPQGWLSKLRSSHLFRNPQQTAERQNAAQGLRFTEAGQRKARPWSGLVQRCKQAGTCMTNFVDKGTARVCSFTKNQSARFSHWVEQGQRRKRFLTMPAKQFKRFANWLEDDPRRVITLPLVTASLGGMLYLAFPVASAIKAGMAVSLAPTLGQSGAQAIAAGFSGALASGVSSLWAHASPMALYNRPFNPGQLGLDVGMSAGFGFLGFVFANGIKQAASVFNGFGKAGLAGRLAFTSSALVGYEVGKDYLQNLAHLKLQHVRYRGLPVVENPKNFRDILKPTVKMEFGTNFWRAIPGLEDQPGLKATFDTLGRVIWDGILNSVNPENVELNRQRLAQQRGLKPVDIIDHDEALRAVDLAHN